VAAGELWTDFNLVWCQPNGKPIDARADWLDWKDLLREAGVRDARVHDGRHTAATMLLLQGIDEQTVMAVMGCY
jgi:integrase